MLNCADQSQLISVVVMQLSVCPAGQHLVLIVVQPVVPLVVLDTAHAGLAARIYNWSNSLCCVAELLVSEQDQKQLKIKINKK